MSIIHTITHNSFKPNREVYKSAMSLKLQKKVGKKDKHCTIKGINTDLFLKLNGLRSIESLQKNKGAFVQHENGTSGRVYFKSYPVGDKIAFFNNGKRELVRPQYLTILSFF